jgi:hypothetical protein
MQHMIMGCIPLQLADPSAFTRKPHWSVVIFVQGMTMTSALIREFEAYADAQPQGQSAGIKSILQAPSAEGLIEVGQRRGQQHGHNYMSQLYLL